MTSEIVAALLGALAAGAFQTIVAISDRRRTSKTMLLAIAAEVQALCALIRHQHYLEAFQGSLSEIEAGNAEVGGWIMDIRSHYFSVFESMSSNLGLLSPLHVTPIVTFYSYCKAAIDSTRPDGPFASECSKEDKENNIRSMVILLEKILRIGDDIVQFPIGPRLPSLTSI